MNRAKLTTTTPQHVLALHWILRIAFVMDFLGHGAYGFLQKASFAKYLGVVGIPPDVGIHLLPVIGVHDYILAFGVLFAPTRAFLLWGAIWGLWTALLRPLTGESWWEVLDRGGNYGMPFALFLLAGRPRSGREWFARVRNWSLPPASVNAFAWTLRLATGFLLIGHGGYGAFVHKEILAKQLAAIGVGPDLFGPGTLLPAIGWFEIALGVATLIRPFPVVLYFITAWKLAREVLYPVTGIPPLHPIFEFIERGGSYACPLALALFLQWQSARESASPPATGTAAPHGSRA
ncbi:MAG: hypothetical protein AABZ94_05230 [Candidatus Eisenbacteria bacterium]